MQADPVTEWRHFFPSNLFVQAIFDWIFSTHSFDMIVRGLLVDLPYDRVTPYHCRPSKQNGGSWLRFLDMGSRHQGVTTALRCAVARRVLEVGCICDSSEGSYCMGGNGECSVFELCCRVGLSWA